MEPPVNVASDDDRRAAARRQHLEAVRLLLDRVDELVAREQELRDELPALRREITDVEKQFSVARRVAEAVPETDDERRREADEQLDALNDRLDGLNAQLEQRTVELEAIGPDLVHTRATLGMKMSDFALEDGEGHEEALTYLQPLLQELRKAYGHALSDAERNAAEVDEELAAQRDAPEALVARRFDPLIAAETVAVTIEQANVRVARHRLALVDPDDSTQRRARDLQLDDAQALLDEARARVAKLQAQKRDAAQQAGRSGGAKGIVKRFGRH
jgi:hypothetical protein